MTTQEQDRRELAAFGASDAACHLYPAEDQQAERAAYIAGAASHDRRVAEQRAKEAAVGRFDALQSMVKDALSAAEPGALREALAQAAACFRNYERQHTEKTPPDTLKAARNRDMALLCEHALGQPAQERGETVARVLREHWLQEWRCDHETETDRSFCYCGRFQSEPQPTVGEAIERWIEHVVAQLAEGGVDPVQDAEPPRRVERRTGGANPPTGAPAQQPEASVAVDRELIAAWKEIANIASIDAKAGHTSAAMLRHIVGLAARLADRLSALTQPREAK